MRHVAFVSLGICVVLGVLFVWTQPEPVWAQQEEVLANGKREYEWYCEFCHGTQGKGDGPLTPHLIVKPPDLTQLLNNHNNEFPVEHVYRVIDGREQVKGHHGGAMPIWGHVFRRQEQGQQTENLVDPQLHKEIVRGRIFSLIRYLESLQDQQDQQGQQNQQKK